MQDLPQQLSLEVDHERMKMVICTRCQKVNPDEAKFCQNCGFTLDPSTKTGQMPLPSGKADEPSRRLKLRIAGLAVIGVAIMISIVGVSNPTLFFAPSLLHPNVTVSGTLSMASGQSPSQITFTDVGDIANSAMSSIQGNSYSVVVPNGHSYNIRIDYSYQYQYQYGCTADEYFFRTCGQGDYCVYDGVGYSCTHNETRTGLCSGGPLKVNVSSSTMTFDIQCS